MAPKCDIVVQKVMLSGLIYFYLTLNMVFSTVDRCFLSFYYQKTARPIFVKLPYG